MKRMKTFLIYALIIVGFYFFSEFLITVGLSASYEDIVRKDNVSQVEIYEAQATLVNGKVKGVIKDPRGNESLTGKYVELDFYSKRDNVVARKYIPIETTDVNTTQEFSIYFEAEDVKSYSPEQMEMLAENKKTTKHGDTWLKKRMKELTGHYHESDYDAMALIENVTIAIERAKTLDKSPADRWPQTVGTRVYLLAQSIMGTKY